MASSAGTPPPHGRLLNLMAGAGAAVGFGGVAPVGALLHPLHHLAQQGCDRPLHVNARHGARL